MTHRFVASLAAGLVLASLSTPRTARAADEPGAASPGRTLYLRYCGACHGPEGRGDGLAGTFIRPKPPDLTAIAQKNGGIFPSERVRAAIDGTTSVGPHGNREMPVWGEVFAEEAGWDMTRRAEVRSKILMLTDYIRSIQRQ